MHLEVWDEKIGKDWAKHLTARNISCHATLAEIAPGDRTKVAHGLKHIGFRGTLHIVEPDAASLTRVIVKYKKILPLATLIPVQKTLKDCVHDIKSASLVLSNHPLDDMLLASSLLSQSDLEAAFSDSDTDAAFDFTKRMWMSLTHNQIDMAMNTVSSEWHSLNKPFIINQYRSGFFTQKRFHRPDDLARRVFNDLAKTGVTNGSFLFA